jgi:hypothetical protein
MGDRRGLQRGISLLLTKCRRPDINGIHSSNKQPIHGARHRGSLVSTNASLQATPRFSKVPPNQPETRIANTARPPLREATLVVVEPAALCVVSTSHVDRRVEVLPTRGQHLLDRNTRSPHNCRAVTVVANKQVL